MEISKFEFPRYRGLTELIPGHVYLDDKGVELLFLGRGKYYREDGYGGWSSPSGRSFLYMKVKDLDAKISDGRLTPGLTTYNPLGPNKPDFWKTVFFSQRPRNLVKDLGERFPANYFENLVVTDFSGNYYDHMPISSYFWHIEAKNI